MTNYIPVLNLGEGGGFEYCAQGLNCPGVEQISGGFHLSIVGVTILCFVVTFFYYGFKFSQMRDNPWNIQK